MERVWEDSIALNSRAELVTEVLGPPADFILQDSARVEWNRDEFPLEKLLLRDTAPLPIPGDREGYYGDDHFGYWASGLRDYCQILEWSRANNVEFDSILDFGCASGRLLRHISSQTEIENIYGCDINRRHIDWISKHLPANITAFQSTSIPSIALPDNSVGLLTAFSVFTHIEAFDTTWLMEIRRILKPGGIAWVTVHGDRTWRDLTPDWPIYGGISTHPEFSNYRKSTEIPKERLVFRWLADGSYSSNIFYSYDYIKSNWSRFLKVRDIFAARPLYQDVVVLQKA